MVILLQCVTCFRFIGGFHYVSVTHHTFLTRFHMADMTISLQFSHVVTRFGMTIYMTFSLLISHFVTVSYMLCHDHFITVCHMLVRRLCWTFLHGFRYHSSHVCYEIPYDDSYDNPVTTYHTFVTVFLFDDNITFCYNLTRLV